MITKLIERLRATASEPSAIGYSLRRSARAKQTRIVVRADKVEVVAPPHVSEASIQRFVQQQQNWIEQARKRVSAKTGSVQDLAPSHYFDGALVPYQGRQLPLTIKFGKAKTPKLRLLEDSQFIVYLPASQDPEHSSERIKLLLQSWMKQQAKIQALQIIDKHAPRFGLQPRSLRIKTQKSRCGSCGPNNDINLNWLLMLAPPEVLEYVVVHELCHIRHKNHSAQFWALVSAHLPDCLARRRWLKQHGASLMRGL